jgi:hypothetical protein
LPALDPHRLNLKSGCDGDIIRGDRNCLTNVMPLTAGGDAIGDR